MVKLKPMSRIERIAYNFRRLRKERKWTHKETATRGGVSHAYVVRVEYKKIEFGARAEVKWADVFGVDISELLAPPRNEAEEAAHKLYHAAKHYKAEDIQKLEALLPVMFTPAETTDDRTIQKDKEARGRAKGGTKSA